MADKSSIEWTDATWNPVMGCTPISEACDNCYARRMIRRYAGRRGWPESQDAVTLFPDRLDWPFRWRQPRRIFVCSMSDLFHPAVPFEFIVRVFDVMARSPRHTFLVLTKRAHRMRRAVKQIWDGFAGAGLETPLPNVWLGVTAENQKLVDERIPPLLETPAAAHFVSVEPMLGPVNVSCWMNCGCDSPENDYCDPGPWCAGYSALDWVIVGGETGPGARVMERAWVEDVLTQCELEGVPFFFKGWGTATMPKTEPDYRVLMGRRWERFPFFPVARDA